MAQQQKGDMEEGRRAGWPARAGRGAGGRGSRYRISPEMKRKVALTKVMWWLHKYLGKGWVDAGPCGLKRGKNGGRNGVME